MKKRLLAILLTLCMLIGLLPTSALAVDGEKRITQAYATVGTGGLMKQVNWLEEGASMQMEIGSTIPFTIVSSSKLEGNWDERTLTMTLKKGLQLVSYNSEQAVTTNRGESDKISGYEALNEYDCQNGSVTFQFTETVSSFSVTGTIRADATVFSGHTTTIEDAITLTYSDSGLAGGTESYSVDVTITGNEVTFGCDNNRTAKETTPGTPARFLGNFSKPGGALFDSLEFSITLPTGLTMQEGYPKLGKTVLSPIGTSQTDTGTVYKYQVQKKYVAAQPSQFEFYVVSDADAEIGTTYTYKIGDIKYQTMGMTELAVLPDYRKELKLVAEKVPEFTYVISSESKVDNINWAKYGNTSEDFTNYQAQLVKSTLKVEYQSLADDVLYYEYIMDASDTTGVFIDRVNIPCSYGQGDEYLPTVIQVTDSTGATHDITGDDVSALSGFTHTNGAIYLKASDIPLAEGVSIVKTVAWIPKFSSDTYSMSGTNTGPAGSGEHASVWGHFVPGEEVSGGITTSFQPITGEETSSYEAVTSVGQLNDSAVGVATRLGLTVDKTALNAGESTDVSFNLHFTGVGYKYGSRLVVDPEFYVFLPPGMSAANVKLTSSVDGDIPALQNDYTTQINENKPDTSETGWGEGWTCLKINPAQTGYVVGIATADGEVNDLTLKFTLNVDPSAATGSYEFKYMIQCRNAAGIAASLGSGTDVYKINDGKSVSVASETTGEVSALTILEKPNVSIDAGFRMEGEQNYYSYVEGDANTQAAFSPGKTGEMRVSLYNGTTDPLTNVSIYIPIPQKEENISPYSGYFQVAEHGFDMSANVTSPPEGWTVRYGTVAAETEGNLFRYDNPPVLENESGTYASGHNMIRLTYTSSGGTFAAGETARFLISYGATSKSAQSDSSNLFRPMVVYQSGGSWNAPDTLPWLWAGLQSGVIDGTVYVDVDRNGTYDAGTDTPVRNAIVTAQVEGGALYTAYSGEDGAYKFEGLPANKPVTVTITSPYSNNPSDANAYRVVTAGLLIAAEDGKSGSTSPLTLNSTGGQATINAALVAPYTVTFAVTDGMNSVVIPASLRRFEGQTIGEYNARVSVVTVAGEQFEGTWSVVGQSGLVIADSNLLTRMVDGDITYQAEVSKTQYRVTFAGWDPSGAYTKLLENNTFEYNDLLMLSPSDKETVSDEIMGEKNPGYDFLGWRENILGDGTLLQLDRDILGKRVMDDHVYYAQYQRRTGISVTLDANGGTFEGGSNKLTLSGLTYGDVVNNAADYKVPTKTGNPGQNFYFVGWAESQGDQTGSATLMVPTETGKTYYAVWAEGEPTEVTVSFDRQGGQWTESGAQSYSSPLEGAPGETLTLPTAGDITRTGYTFDGWYTDSNCTTPATAAFPITDQTLYAKWTPNQHTIIYDLNGGNVDGSNEDVIKSNVDYDSTLMEVPDPTRAGYTLIGWMVSAPADNPAYGYIIPAANMTTRKVDGNITYTAQWSANAEQVTFHANPTGVSGAAFSDGTTEKTFSNSFGSAMPFADVPAPVRPGYTFKGWVTSEDGTGQLQSGSFTFNGQTTDYYAQWEATKVTVTFNANGGTATGQTTFTQDYGKDHPDFPAVTLDGSELAYWLDMETGTKYAQTADASAGIEAFPNGTVTENKTYLAIWNNVQYTVTFTGYNNNSDIKEIPTAYDGTPAAPAVTPPEGQVFQHWKVTASESEGITEGSTYTSDQLLNLQIRGDVTFEAVFDAATVTVTYLATPGAWEDGDTSKTISGKSGDPIRAPEDPTREGYTFAVWSKNLTTFPTENKTLTASWTANPYTITFDKNLDMDKDAGTQPENVVTVTGTYDQTLEHVTNGTIPTDFAPNGYTFVGWESEDGSIYPEITKQIVRGAATYTAYFTSSAGNTVTFHANKTGESGAAFAGDALTKEYQITTAADFTVNDVPLPVWAEHTFVKWVDAEGQDAPATLTFGNTANGKDYYAVYETTTYTVTFNYNGGTDGNSTGPKEITGKTLNETVAEGEVPVLTLEGKNFLGWLNLNDNQTYETAAEVAAVQITADTSYIALWDTQTFDVIYRGYNQSSDTDTATIPTVYGQPPAAPAVVPNGGHAFDHWRVIKPSDGVTVDGQIKTQLTADDLAKLKVTQDITLQAMFKATDYTVTFDANGGTFDGGSAPTYSVAYGKQLSMAAGGFTAPTVNKTGAEFLGWTKTGDSTLYTNGAQDSNYIGDVVITGDTVFIASWSGDVRVTFNANGGTIGNSDYAEGQTGTTISAPTPTRYGYDFDGWYTDSDCQTSAAESDGSYKFPATNATWYAKWTAKNVTVTFNYGNGAVGGDKTSTITKSFDSKLSEADIPAPTLAGFTLTGWSREDGTIIPNDNMTSEVINTEGTVTYTAYYTANPITITFDPNGGTFPDGTSQSKSYMKSEGDTMPFADVPVPALAAKTFEGWKLEGEEDSPATTEGSMHFDSAKTYVAVWSDAQYAITFRLSGGSVSGNSADVVNSVDHGDLFPTPPNVTLSGNTLRGWMNMADGQMYGGTNTAFPATVTESATYIAIWGTNTYNVIFTKYDYSDQAAGDSSSLTIPTIYEGIPAAPTVTPPTGRQFTAWKITSGSLMGESGELTVNATITSAELTKCKVIGNVTLEAQYSDPGYTVTFNPGEGAQLDATDTYEVTNGKTMAEMNFTVPTATKDGATSTSWICSLDGSAMTADEIKDLVIHSDVTFTAVWVGDVTVSFVLNGGSIINNVPASVTGAPGTEVLVPLVQQEGHSFDGWYDAETGGNPVTFPGGKTTIGNTSVTYYARWTQNTLTVTPGSQTSTYTITHDTTPTWTVKDSAGKTLTEADYSVTYFNRETGVTTVDAVPTDAGTYTVTFRGKDSYLGKTATATYIIERADLSSAVVTVTDYNKVYNGSEQYASVSVVFEGSTLIMGKDFTVTYGGGCVNAGDYSITVTGMGNYTGTAAVNEKLTISAKALVDEMIQAIPPQYYTGQELEPGITVQDNDLVLHAGTDFENVTYSNNVQVGSNTASVTITGKGNYTGTAVAYFSIIAKATELDVSVTPASATYGDDLSGMTITVAADGENLVKEQDYTLSYQRYSQSGEPEAVENIDQAGVYIITANGMGNYAGSKGSTVFVLNPQNESDGALAISQNNIEVVYDGTSHLPNNFTVQWKDGSGSLVDLSESEYELFYSYNNSAPMEVVIPDTEFIDVGIYVVTVKATGNYSGSATFVVTITPKDISDSSVDVDIREATYNAGLQNADVTVTDGGENLTQELDYTVANDAYTDANEDGYEVLITGKGNYTGSRTETFIIRRAVVNVTADQTSITYGDPLPDISTITPNISGIYEADAAGVTVTLGWPADLDAGTHALTATLSGERSSNYVADTSGATLHVGAKDMTGADSGVNASLNPGYGYYTGSALTPNVVVTDSKLGKTLVRGTDYTVSYEDGSGPITQLIDIGTYTVVVTGIGNYTGTFRLEYTIQNQPSGGGGGGGGGGGMPTTYAISVPETKHGSVTVNPENAAKGTTVTVVVTPDTGYVLKSLTVTDKDGKEQALKDLGGGTFTFVMPASKVTITAEFQAEPEEVPDSTFSDVPSDAWYAEAVQYVYEKGLMQGISETEFAPNVMTSRTMLATILWRLEGEPKVDYTIAFTDVAGNAWYTEAVRWAAAKGIIEGYSDTLFGSEDNITREQMAVMLWRYLGSPAASGSLSGYPDAGAVSSWATQAMVWAVETGLITGNGAGQLNPQGTASRAEIATFLMRVMEIYGK